MRRRALLRGSVAVLPLSVLSGCLDGSNDDGDDVPESPERAEDDEPERAEDDEPERAEDDEPERLDVGDTATLPDGTSLTVSAPTVQKSIIAAYPEFPLIEREDGHQYVVIDVDGEFEPEPEAFALEIDGEVVDPPSTRHPVDGIVRDCTERCIGVPAVVEPVDSLGVAYRSEGTEAVWKLGDEHATALADPPTIELREASLVDLDGDAGLEVVVENVGDRDGGFRALVDTDAVSHGEEPIGVAVAADGVVTETFAPASLDRIDPDDAAFADDPRPDTRFFTVTVDPS